MRAVVQRVSEASVVIDGEVTGEISNGILILLAVRHGDGEEEAKKVIDKIASLRIFNDEHGKMNLSIAEKFKRPECLVVSNFTLYANVRKGRRPAFFESADPEKAVKLYNFCVKRLKIKHKMKVQTGVFGAHMEVKSVNDGPVTIIVDSHELRNKK